MRIHNSVYLFVVLALAVLSGWLYSVIPYRLGLDIRGGARFTLSIDSSKLTEEQKKDLPKLNADIYRILDTRTKGPVGAVESTVQRKGADQFVVELPGLQDLDRARELLITTASIKVYHAKNVVAPLAPARVYEYDPDPIKINRSHVYQFRLRTNPDKVVKPGTPEYLAMIRGWGEPILNGDMLAKAEALPYKDGYMPLFNFTREGAQRLERWTRRYKQENIAFVLDNRVLSIAPVKANTILSDNANIEGEFETEYVRDLIEVLNSGALPVDLLVEEEESVDPTIGSGALDQILLAGYISLGITALFIVVYYMFPGLVALLALILYTLFTLTALKLLHATFSLAAIAGMILSVGMAVDANILIFERIKEELKLGKVLQSAVKIGFSRALPAIIDSNACTIITSLVLMSIGSGPVKGFASTLIVGVAISLFTAVTVTRWLLTFLIGANIGTNPKLYGLSRGWFGEHWEGTAGTNPFRIVEKRNTFFMISLLTIVVPGIFFFFGGLKPNVEFLGGYEATFNAGNVTKAQLDQKISENYRGGNVKLASSKGEQYFIATIPPNKELESLNNNSKAATTVSNKLGFGGEFRGFRAVGPTIQKEAIAGAVKGVLLSSFLIVCYLAIRFGVGLGGFKVGLRFSLAAIIALLHDLLVVVALAALFGYLLGWEVSGLFITAMLTVVGFSTHDTIVIFDRIRENLHKPLGNEDSASLINRSIKQSIARSINTASTVIVTLAILIAIGSATPDLRFFNAIMLSGIVTGTYSSIFNASPIMYLIDKWFSKKGEEHTLMGIAKRELMHAHVSTAGVPSRESAPTTLESQAYGQVKRRRASEKGKGHVNLDDEP